MEKKFWLGLVFGVMMFGITGLASATTINFSSKLDSDSSKTSTYDTIDGFLLETFDSSDLIPLNSKEEVEYAKNNGRMNNGDWTYTGSGYVANGFEQSIHAAPGNDPYDDYTNYLYVPEGNQNLTISFGGMKYNYFGLWWGSMDSGNKITFLNGNEIGLSFNGVDIIGFYNQWAGVNEKAHGDQYELYNNLYVNFLDVGLFDAVKFETQSNPFESDNLTVGKMPVPEPTTMLLLGLGLMGLVGFGKKFRSGETS
jgi:hypothetical protein